MPKPVSYPFPIRAQLPVNSAFGKRPLYNDFHSGVDFNSTTGANLGTPVRAAGYGRVVESYNGNSAGMSNWAKLRGTMVAIDHGDGWRTRYHMLVPNSNIPVGTIVYPGDVIGRVGNSGSSGTGAHLHFELWHNGVAINPVGQLTYNPAAFASGGSTPFDNEDEMTPEQDSMLRNIYAAIFTGGPSMPDNARSIGKSLAGIVTVVDQIKSKVNQPTPTVVRSKDSKATLLPDDGSSVELSKVQDDADTNSLLRELAARPVSGGPAPVAEIDYDRLATLIVQKLPNSAAATKEDVAAALQNLTLSARVESN